MIDDPSGEHDVSNAEGKRDQQGRKENIRAASSVPAAVEQYGEINPLDDATVGYD